MENKKTLEDVRRIFEGDRFATENGAVIEEIGEHSATCSLDITNSHRNAMGAVMGGTYFMLADFAFAVAANNSGPLTVTAVSQISFLSAARGSVLTAETRLVKDGKRSCHYLIEITDDQDTLVATVSSTGMHLNN